MSNWVEGILKIRGSDSDLRKFITEAVTPCPDHKIDREKLETVTVERQAIITEDRWGITVEAPEGFYFKGAKQCFISTKIHWDFMDNQGIINILGFSQAWDIDTEFFAKLSKEYEIDIKIYGFENSDEFSREVEIHKGAIIRDETKRYGDYRWECILPDLGG